MTLVEDAENELERSDSIVCLFHAKWCPFCRSFRPTFQSIAKSSDRDFTEVDISDEACEYWDKYGIGIVPTVIVFSGGEVVARRDGKPHKGLKESELKDLLDET